MPKTNLFEVALTHSSHAYEHGGEHNERLEFLGDAVLDLCISHLLYDALPEEREGVLSRVRRGLINAKLLARLALDLGLDQGLRVGAGEGTEALRTETKPLSDVWEAMLGAVYLEGGLDAAMEVVREAVLPHLDDAQNRRDPKSRLQEWCQRNHGGAVPEYQEIDRVGPDNDPLWTVQVVVAGQVMGQGRARRKKEAERAAARAAVDRLGLDGDD